MLRKKFGPQALLWPSRRGQKCLEHPPVTLLGRLVNTSQLPSQRSALGYWSRVPCDAVLVRRFVLPSRLHLTYLRKLQRPHSRLAYLRYDVYRVHRRHNLPNSALNRVSEVVLVARLENV